MVTNWLDKYKVSTTKQAVTSFAGLPLLMGMAKSLGLEKTLNRLPVKERSRGYKPAEIIFTMMGLLQSGGVALDDVSVLSGDGGMRELLGKFPAANTLGAFLRRFRNSTIHRLGKIQLETAVKVIELCGLKSVIVDVDAFFLESQKSGVKMNYEGELGYNPVAVTCADLKMPLTGLFRAGNASPMAHLSGLLDRALSALSGVSVRVRSDSAGYQAGVVRVLRDHGADFTITVRKDESVKESIRGIAEGEWKRYDGGAWEGRESEIAETVHAFGDESLPAYRMIVIRWKKEQADLFDRSPYEYHGVLTSLDHWSAGLVMQFHRTRQDGSENVNKELSGGFGLSKLPCREMKANAAYFQMALLACTVFVAMKHLVLPKGWWHWTVKKVRFSLIRLAGIVGRRARSVWLKIPKEYVHRGVFEEARSGLLWITARLAPV
jgi:hypothetical protein